MRPSTYCNSRNNSLSCYRKHKYSGPRQSRKKILASLKRHHGEGFTLSSLVDLRRNRNKNIKNESSNCSRSEEPPKKEIKTYARKLRKVLPESASDLQNSGTPMKTDNHDFTKVKTEHQEEYKSTPSCRVYIQAVPEPSVTEISILKTETLEEPATSSVGNDQDAIPASFRPTMLTLDHIVTYEQDPLALPCHSATGLSDCGLDDLKDDIYTPLIQQLEQKDNFIEGHLHNYGIKNEKINENDGTFQEQDQRLKQKYKWLIERDQKLKQKEQKLKEWDQKLKEKDKRLKERDQTFNERTLRLIEREQKLNEKDKKFKACDLKLEEKDQSFKECDQKLEEKAMRLIERDQKLNERTLGLIEREQKLNEKDQRLKQCDQKLEDKDRTLKEKNDKIESLLYANNSLAQENILLKLITAEMRKKINNVSGI